MDQDLLDIFYAHNIKLGKTSWAYSTRISINECKKKYLRHLLENVKFSNQTPLRKTFSGIKKNRQ